MLRTGDAGGFGRFVELERKDIKFFKHSKALWSEGRHAWVNSNAASGAVQGFHKDDVRKKLLEKAGELDSDEFTRFFDLGWDWGLSKRTETRLGNEARKCGWNRDVQGAEALTDEAVRFGVNEKDAFECVDNAWREGMELRNKVDGR